MWHCEAGGLAARDGRFYMKVDFAPRGTHVRGVLLVEAGNGQTLEFKATITVLETVPVAWHVRDMQRLLEVRRDALASAIEAMRALPVAVT